MPRPAETYPQRAPFAEFPMSLGGMQGRSEKIDAVYDAELQMDDYLLANYVDKSGGVVNLYMSWYNSQRKGEAVHSPRSCLPGGGWQIKEFGQQDIPGATINGQLLRVNRVVVELGTERQLVYYWFQQRGRVIDNEFAVKWYLFWDALTRHRTDGALVRLIVPLPPSEDISVADRQLTRFAAYVAGDLTRFVPN